MTSFQVLFQFFVILLKIEYNLSVFVKWIFIFLDIYILNNYLFLF